MRIKRAGKSQKCLLTNAVRREPKPIAENSPTLVIGIECQKSMEPILLLATTTASTHHLLRFELAGLHVNVLLERVQVEQGQDLIPSVVGPIRSENLFLNGTSIAAINYIDEG